LLLLWWRPLAPSRHAPLCHLHAGVLLLLLLLPLLLLGKGFALPRSVLRHHVDADIDHHRPWLDPAGAYELRAAHCNYENVCCAANGRQVGRLQRLQEEGGGQGHALSVTQDFLGRGVDCGGCG
jgi:hypothetical protein